MILLTLGSGLKALYHKSDIRAVMEYEHKHAEDRPKIKCIVTVHIWTIGSTTPIVQNVLVRDSIDDIDHAMRGSVYAK